LFAIAHGANGKRGLLWNAFAIIFRPAFVFSVWEKSMCSYCRSRSLEEKDYFYSTILLLNWGALRPEGVGGEACSNRKIYLFTCIAGRVCEIEY